MEGAGSLTAVLVALALTAGIAIGWWACNERHETRALDAHLAEVKADVYRESGERLYDQLQAERAAHTPELTRLRDKAIRWRGLALRGRTGT